MTVNQHTRKGNWLKPTKMCSLKNGLSDVVAEGLVRWNCDPALALRQRFGFYLLQFPCVRGLLYITITCIRKLVKPTKKCSLENRLWLLMYVGRPTPKLIEKWSRKTSTDVRKISPQNKGERLL